MRRIRSGTPRLVSFRPVLLLALLTLAPAAHAGQLVFTPGNYDFGTVTIPDPPVVGRVLVTNHGTPTTLFGFETGAGCGDFTAQIPGAPVTIANGETLSIVFTYDPATRGPDACSFELVDDNGVTDIVGLAGDCLAPQLFVPEPALTFTTQSWETGIPETLYVSLENLGNLPIEAANFTSAFQWNAHFTLGEAPLPIAPGAVAYLPVIFDPLTPGSKSDVLELGLDNDSSVQDVPVALDGTWTGDPTGVGETGPGGARLAIGPSPSRGTVDVSCAVPRPGRLVAEVRDLAGRLVARSETFAASAGPRTISLRRGVDWSPAPGVYVVRVRLDGTVLGHGRVVVVR